MFNLNLLKVVVTTVWLLIPFNFLILLSLIAFEYTNQYISWGICFATTHSIVDFIILIIFIRPYRDYLKKLLFKLAGKTQIKTKTSDISSVDIWRTQAKPVTTPVDKFVKIA